MHAEGLVNPLRCTRCNGKSFSAGADFSAASLDVDQLKTIYDAAARLFEVTLPIVGAIHGPAVGGGLGLAMVPDVRIAAPEARFCVSCQDSNPTTAFSSALLSA